MSTIGESNDTTTKVPEDAEIRRAPSEALHAHAFWFYGIVVALAIEQGATPVIRRFVASPNDASWMEGLRLGVLLLVSMRLLLGAAVHFDEVRREDFPGSYRLDFLSGFVHFLLLFCWSFTIQRSSEPGWISPYLLLLFFVIGYDLIWLFVICRGSATNRVKGWTFINSVTLVLGLLCFFAAKAFGWGFEAEHYPVLAVVTLISVLDLGELTSGERYMIPWLTSWMNDSPPSGSPPISS